MERLIYTLSLAVALALVGVPPATFADQHAGNDAIMHKLDALSRDIDSLRREVRQLRTEVRTRQRAAAASPGAAVALQKAAKYEVALKASDQVKGSADAKVAMVEFSDFECPFCYRFHTQVFPQIAKRYINDGRVKYVFKHFPLAFHSQGKSASEAAVCAARFGRFWDMHSGLFAAQRSLGATLYRTLAGNSGIETVDFQKCLMDPKIAQLVDDDIAQGEALGVRGTPAFFIGRVEGEKVVAARNVSGAQPFPVFMQVIEAALK